jgi:hypothetical protein
MHSRGRTLTLGVVLALGAVLGADIANLSAQASDPRIGTWKLNVAKSKYSPGPAPQALTVNVEPSGKGEKVTTEFVNADGTRTTTEYTANFDGRTIRSAGPRSPTRCHSSEATPERQSALTRKAGRRFKPSGGSSRRTGRR